MTRRTSYHVPVDVRELVSHFGHCAPQPATDWQGDIPLPEELINFYLDVGPLGERTRKGHDGVSVPSHGNDIQLVPLAQLWKEQADYRWYDGPEDPNPEWPDAWIVFAWEGVDAYVYDSAAQSVLFILPGGVDDPFPISGTPKDVVGALALFAIRLAEDGDSALLEDLAFSPTWLDTVRGELVRAFGQAGEDVISVITEV